MGHDGTGGDERHQVACITTCRDRALAANPNAPSIRFVGVALSAIPATTTPKASCSPVFLRSRPRWAEAEEVVAVTPNVTATICCATVLGVEVPRTAAPHPVRASISTERIDDRTSRIATVPIPYLLVDVARHIVEAPVVRDVLTDGVRLATRINVIPGDPTYAALIRTAVPGRSCTRLSGVFPLGLSWQAVPLAVVGR